MPRVLRDVLVLVFALSLVFNVGCASQRGLSTLGGDDVAACSDPGGGSTGLRTIGDRSARLASYALVGLLLAAVVTIDLLLLPFTQHEPFPCCRGIISICH